MSNALTQADVERLLADRTPATRVEAATRVARAFERTRLSERERAIAADIFRVLARDVEQRVRAALAEQLKESRLLPRDIAMTLARDVADVALPILQYSEVLTDDDLIEILGGGEGPKQVAIARRRQISERVAGAIVDTGNSEAVAELASNSGARLGESALHRLLDRYGETPAVKHRLARRLTLPPAVAERLVSAVSERLREHLLAIHELPADTVSDLIQFSREHATLGIVWSSGTNELDRFVKQLHASDRLTPTLLLRALCMGDRLFFETGIAARAGIPVKNAAKLIDEAGRFGFQALYRQSDLPSELYSAFAVALEVARQTELDSRDEDRDRFRQRMIERILTQFDEIDADNLDYLLAKLNRSVAAQQPVTVQR